MVVQFARVGAVPEVSELALGYQSLGGLNIQLQSGAAALAQRFAELSRQAGIIQYLAQLLLPAVAALPAFTTLADLQTQAAEALVVAAVANCQAEGLAAAWEIHLQQVRRKEIMAVGGFIPVDPPLRPGAVAEPVLSAQLRRTAMFRAQEETAQHLAFRAVASPMLVVAVVAHIAQAGTLALLAAQAAAVVAALQQLGLTELPTLAVAVAAVRLLRQIQIMQAVPAALAS